MSANTPVNGQITDSVTQGNLAVLGAAPAMALGSIYQTGAHATGLMFQNSVQAQQQAAIAAQAAANQGIIQIYSANSMAGATAASKIARSDTPSTLMTLLVALEVLKRL